MPRASAALAIVVVVLAGATAALRPGPSPEPEPRIAVLPAAAKVRPHDRPQGSDRVALTLMRGECEMAHLAVVAGRAPLSVTAHALLEPAAGVRVELSREALVTLLRASGPDGDSGEWPDPIIPEVDAFAGEHRRAFPVEVPAGEARSVLVMACAAADASPGRRAGSVALQLGGRERKVPLSVEVVPVSIPATATLPTTFGLASRSAALGTLGRPASQDELLRQDRLYRTALLAHRLSAHGGTWDPPPFREKPGGGIDVDFGDYDREVGPFLSGTALKTGARATTVELRTHPKLSTDLERIAYYRAQVRHLEGKHWSPILFSYEKDEPRPEDLPGIVAHATVVKEASPSIRVLVTATISPPLVGLVDLWVPNLNCLFMKKSPDEFCPSFAAPAAYQDTRGRGAQLWWYQSCSSHGCDDGPRLPYFTGWPSYMVDASGARARAMAWLAWLHGIGGELYWDVTAAYTVGEAPGDPWAPGGLWKAGGNGDGTLFYPGTPAHIGGKTPVPVSSLRLELIRDGLEDFELLRQVAARPGGEAVARKAALEIAPDVYRITTDPAAFDRARARLLAFMAGGGSE